IIISAFLTPARFNASSTRGTVFGSQAAALYAGMTTDISSDFLDVRLAIILLRINLKLLYHRPEIYAFRYVSSRYVVALCAHGRQRYNGRAAYSVMSWQKNKDLQSEVATQKSQIQALIEEVGALKEVPEAGPEAE